MKTLKIEPLTREAFAPYGEVIECEGRDFFHINAGMVERYNDLANVDTSEGGGRTLVSLLRASAHSFPSPVCFVERHPMSSQAFIPLDDNPFLVVATTPGDTVRAADLRAFVTNGRQGVNYRRGVWHHVLLVPRRPMQFVVVDRGGPGDNCEEFWFDDGEQCLLDY